MLDVTAEYPCGSQTVGQALFGAEHLPAMAQNALPAQRFEAGGALYRSLPVGMVQTNGHADSQQQLIRSVKRSRTRVFVKPAGIFSLILMNRHLLIAVSVLGLILAVPVLLRDRGTPLRAAGDPLVIVTPHNEAIRYEFDRAFRAWYRRQTGRDVVLDWRTPGGTSEISRHLSGEYTAAFRQAWSSAGEPWTPEIQAAVLDRKLRPDSASVAAWKARQAFLQSDTGIGIDLFFGGGQYDCQRLADAGILVSCGLRERLPELFGGPEPLIPQKIGGEIWYDPQDRYYGTCLTAFGICWNPRRLQEVAPAASEPSTWRELSDPRFIGQIGLGDPSKSGSVAKAFEMLVQQELARAIAALPPQVKPGDPQWRDALGRGWEDAMLLVKCICANARYFTISAGKVPMDVAAGDAVAGMCIDFYGRFQAEWENRRAGETVLRYVTPDAGSSVSADPIALLRGAPHRETAVRFLDFVFSSEGQRLWNYRVGVPGGPARYALRRLPIRRDLYSSADREQMADPEAEPFNLASSFTYHPEWTGALFNLLRLQIRVMGIDVHAELREAWAAIQAAGGPAQNPEAMAHLRALPFAYAETGEVAKQVTTNQDAVRLSRVWAAFFREHYRQARQAAERGHGAEPGRG